MYTDILMPVCHAIIFHVFSFVHCDGRKKMYQANAAFKLAPSVETAHSSLGNMEYSHHINRWFLIIKSGNLTRRYGDSVWMPNQNLWFYDMDMWRLYGWDIVKSDGIAPRDYSIVIALMCERIKTVNAISTEYDSVLPWLWIIIFYSGLCSLRLISLFWL